MKEQHKKIIVMVIVGSILFLFITNWIRPRNLLLFNQNGGENTNGEEVKKIETLTIKIEELDNSAQSGTAQLTSVEGGKTKIDVTVNASTSSAQPLYIQKGTCTNPSVVNELLVPLTNGSSSTIIERSINDLLTEPLVIVVHHSLLKLTQLTACGEINFSTD